MTQPFTITAEFLRELFLYEEESGLFIRRISRGNRGLAGQIAGYVAKTGYRVIGIGPRDGFKMYLAHRLAWLYMTGAFPENEIDHINGVKDDNRWCNLREATRSQNLQNIRCRSSSLSRLKGVQWDRRRKKWASGIFVNKRHLHLGYFTSATEAHEAYVHAAKEHFGEFARG
jgi:hypothetical protein